MSKASRNQTDLAQNSAGAQGGPSVSAQALVMNGPAPLAKPAELDGDQQATAYALLREFHRHAGVQEFLDGATHPLVAPDGSRISRVLTTADLPEIKRLLLPFTADSRVAKFLNWE